MQMEEMQEMALTVKDFFIDIAHAVQLLDEAMAFVPHIAGSVAEGTKVQKPDEMDVVCLLSNLKNIVFSDENGSIVIRQEGKYYPWCTEEGVITPSSIRKYLYSLMAKVLRKPDLWKKYSKLGPMNVYSISHKTAKLQHIDLIWRGNLFPSLCFSVDVVPAIDSGDWLPQTALPQHPLISKNRCMIIQKGLSVEHTASYECSETDMLRMMPKCLKQAFALSKVINRALKVDFVDTYTLKTATFHVFSEYPDYERRLSEYIRDEGEQSRQPYGPDTLAPVEDIIQCATRIYDRLLEAAASGSLPLFFSPHKNLLHATFDTRYLRLYVLLCKLILVDPKEQAEEWKQLCGQIHELRAECEMEIPDSVKTFWYIRSSAGLV
jgi:hypothetical protein